MAAVRPPRAVRRHQLLSPPPFHSETDPCFPADDMARCAGGTGHCCGRCASLANCRTCRFSLLCCTALFPCCVVFSLVWLLCVASALALWVRACVWREWPAFVASTASDARVCVCARARPRWALFLVWFSVVACHCESRVSPSFKIGTSSCLSRLVKIAWGGACFLPSLLGLVQLLLQFGLVGARRLAVGFCQTTWTGWLSFFPSDPYRLVHV